jgi:hypothetical protein
MMEESKRGKKSKYQKKQKLKRGKGRIDPRWVSWFEDPDHPRAR